jgi:hypothetical protein
MYKRIISITADYNQVVTIQPKLKVKRQLIKNSLQLINELLGSSTSTKSRGRQHRVHSGAEMIQELESREKADLAGKAAT